MALSTCRECGKPASTEAQTCPHCGVPSPAGVKGSAARGWVWIIATIAIVGAFVAMSSQSPPARAPATAQPKPTIDKSEATQQKRAELLAKLQRMGVLAAYECRKSGATIEVRPAFLALDFREKQQFANVVWAYCFDGSQPYTVLGIVDVRDRRAVGRFSAATGLTME